MSPDRKSQPWSCSWPVVLAGSLLVPPAGWVLLWKRDRPGVTAKALLMLPLAVLAVAHLYLFWQMRVELDGRARPMIVFGDRERHWDRLEQERAAEQQPHPAVAPAEPSVAQAASAAGPAEPEAAATATSAGSAVRAEPGWTGYRGPGRDGVYRETRILTRWPEEGLPEVWRKPVGGGYASMAVGAGRVYTIEQRRDQEVAAAYDLRTGREVWADSWSGFFRESMGGDGPRATPTYHEGKVYALGAEGEFRCLDAATGKVLWRKNILSDNGASNLTWGMSASPLVVDGKVIVLPGGSRGRSVVAYDSATGERVWSALDDKAAYTAPQIAELAGQRQLVVVTARRVAGLSIEEGELLWEYPWTTAYDVNSAQPIVVDRDRFVISSGYDHGAALVRVVREGGGFQAREVWVNRNMKNKFNSSVLHEGHIYGLDESILACVDVETGERKWKGGRYGFGQLLLADGHLVITTETGEVVLVKATPEGHEELARFPALDGKTWNVPALSEGLLLVRNQTEMACFRIAPPATARR